MKGPIFTAVVLLAIGGCTPDAGRPLGESSSAGGSHAAVATPAFPLRTSANGRFLEDQNSVPVPILGRTAWFVISLPPADFTTFLNDTLSRGYNALEMHVIDHDPRGNNPPRNGNGDLPFLKRLDGAPWSGALTYANINAEAPDFSTPNEAYWTFVDSFLATCESQGVMVFFFPAYVGFSGGDQGWMQEMTANGAARMRQYGAFLGARYQGRKNIVWMMGGDMGGFTAAQDAAEGALIGGLKSVPGQLSNHFSAEWNSNSVCTDESTYGGNCTLEGAYSFGGQVVTYARNGYGHAPIMPTFLLEEPYDEEGPDGNNFNPNATQPVRRFQIWGWLSGIAGYVSGNGFVWPFRTGWQNHLNTQGAQDMARLNGLIRSIAWQDLVPSGLGGMKSLVTSGGGVFGGSDYVAAAATPGGSLLLAYAPPTGTAGRSFAIDMTAMGGATRARWWNPTTGAFTDIAPSLPNSGSTSFTTPGDNGTAQNDWILVLTRANASAPPTVATAASASPNPVAGSTTSLSVLGADDGGEASLVYTWAAVGAPPAPVSFSANGTNAAKNAAASFRKAGTYTLQATIADADGQTVASSTTVTVSQTPAGVAVSPANATVAPNATQQFIATAVDQFGFALATQPAFSWTVSGGGTIDTNGLFTASAVTGGPFAVTATAGASGSASVTVANVVIAAYRIRSGAGGAVGSFSADQLFLGGNTFSTGTAVSTAGVANAAPAAVYQAERYGNFTYTLTGLSAGATYTVRLHFAEVYWSSAGARVFNVSINGAQVLTNFDIFAAAGGNFKALVRDFTAAANGSGQIVLQYSTIRDNAKSSGLEILSGPVTSTPPTVATAASASPNPVAGTTTSLSVLGADDGGEAALIYTWAAVGAPPAPVSFSANGTNAAKNVTARFSRAGTYTLQATIADAGGQTVSSSTTATVSQTPAAVAVSPASATVAPNAAQQFTAAAVDQFGLALATQPAFSWAVSGGGTIDTNGLFTASAVSGGPFTVTATAGANGTASVTVASVVTAAYRIRSGGGGAVGTFSADRLFSGGNTFATGSAVSTAGVANAAPAAVYQGERYGNFTYTLTGLAAGATYTVRLHFAEVYWSSAGARVFNVSINGAQVLTNFDIFVAAGGNFKALVRDFAAAANPGGQIVLQYSTVRDNAKSSGLEILSGP